MTGSRLPKGDRGTATTDDRFGAAHAVANAVLYEGYVLYPYRASAQKNQARWQFGVLAPRAFSERDGSERWMMRTESIVDPGQSPKLTVRIRCLHLQHRTLETPAGEATDHLEVDGAVHVPWDEAVEQAVDLPAWRLLPLPPADQVVPFHFPGSEETEVLRGEDGTVGGRIRRRREAIDGRVRVGVEWAAGASTLLKVTATVDNITDWSGAGAGRDDVVRRSLAAVHTMLAVDDAEFVSLLDPPPDARDAVAGCVNDGTYPVLVGSGDVVLSSPIILYDHPEVADESPGDLYDATEIDEILALRVLTLTDDEKAEARATDPRAAAIIDRCDNMPEEIWARLHGAVRALQPSAPEPEAEPLPWWEPSVDASVDPWTDTLSVAGVKVGKGSRVRLRPSRRADAQDLFFAGLEATVTGVFKDVDDDDHVAVSIDDDPASEALEWQGRYLFFYPDEIEPLDREAGGAVTPDPEAGP